MYNVCRRCPTNILRDTSTPTHATTRRMHEYKRAHCMYTETFTKLCPCSVWINVASVKHYLKAVTAIEAKQSALNARKPVVGRREPHLCSLPVEPRAYRDPPPLAG